MITQKIYVGPLPTYTKLNLQTTTKMSEDLIYIKIIVNYLSNIRLVSFEYLLGIQTQLGSTSTTGRRLSDISGLILKRAIQPNIPPLLPQPLTERVSEVLPE